MSYNILLMGASYGSLLASKLLFGGHKIHLVCLPPEAELINAEGFRVRLPVRGRKEPVVLELAQAAGQGDGRRRRRRQPQGLRPRRACACRSRSTARPACASCWTRWRSRSVPCMSIMNMPPLPYVKRIPGLDYEALRPAYTDPTVWDTFDPGVHDAEQPRPAGDPPARGEGQRADGHAADQLQGGEVRRRQVARRSCASWRRTWRRRASTRRRARSSCR